jgi:two-component system OmpR family sensor kinase
VADASHELRTPLATIRGYAELYRMGALPDRHALDDTIGRIEGSATRMGALVEDLLALARLDEGRPLTLGPVDLVVLAADAVADLRALDPGRPDRLVGLADDEVTGPVWVRADEARMRQVVANLVGNVARHTPPGTPAELAVGTTTDAAGTTTGVLEVRDHGPGIAPEHAARVFERFYRVDASRTRDSGGAGLGMAIVSAIVAAHDGSVELLQTPGGGATLRVALPADRHPPAEDDTAGIP